MNEDQYDAAEREMDLYRAEITRITAAHDETRARLRETAAGNIALRKLAGELLPALPRPAGDPSSERQLAEWHERAAHLSAGLPS